MKFSKYNKEGYYDPTAYEAFTNIEAQRRAAQPPFAMKAYRPIVFICSPYADDPLNNERRAIRYCRFAVRHGCIPIAPHIYFPPISGRPQSGRTGARPVHGTRHADQVCRALGFR